MDKITNWLYIGGKTTKEAIAYNKIKYVINLSGVPCDYEVDATISIADAGAKNNNTPERFIRIIKEINTAVKNGKTPIFLMCHAGNSRSPALASLYLYYNHDFDSFDDALDYVKKHSNIANPNPNFIDFIKKKVIPKMVSELID